MIRSAFLANAILATTLAAVCATSIDAPTLRVRGDGRLEVSAPPAGTVIRYTLDGADPTRDAGEWLASVEAPAGYTVKARAFTPDGTGVGEIATWSAAASGTPTPSTLVPVTQNRDWRVYDWTARHAAAVALMKTRQPEIVMLGDSITHFWGGEPVGGRRNGARGMGPLLRRPTRRQSRLRVGPHRERPLAAHARRVRRRHAEGRGDDGGDEQHHAQHGRRDRRRRRGDLRRNPSTIAIDEDPAPRHLPARREARRHAREARRGQPAPRPTRRPRRRHVPRHRRQVPRRRRLDHDRRDVRLPAPHGEGLCDLVRRNGATLERLLR